MAVNRKRKIKVEFRNAFGELAFDGHLGFIRPGTSFATVEELLGTPYNSGYGPWEGSKTFLASYKALEFSAEDDKITSISLSLLDEPPRLPRNIVLHDIPDAADRTMEIMKHRLSKKNITWVIDKYMTDEWQTNLVTDRDVHFAFNPEGVLTRIGVAPELRNLYFK